MWKYVLKRLGLLFITTFIILSLTYILLQCLPVEVPRGSDTAIFEFYQTQVSLGYYKRIDESMGNLYQQYVADVLHSDYKFQLTSGKYVFYVQLPIMTRYFNWLKNIVTKWDWGTSTQISIGATAISIIMRQLPVSMKLNIIAMFISVPCGIGLGIWAALKKNKLTDHIISTLVMVFISVPSFVLISFLLIWLAYGTGWVSYQWPSVSQAQNWVVSLKGYIIPVTALCFGSIASFARYTRAELCEVMSSEFLLLARTKGLTRAQAVVKHALRNSMVPIVPMIISEFVGILSGSMILEQLYGIPGIGQLFVNALTAKDYSVVMVDMAIYTVIGLLATLVIDLSYGIVDPRIRMGASK